MKKNVFIFFIFVFNSFLQAQNIEFPIKNTKKEIWNFEKKEEKKDSLKLSSPSLQPLILNTSIDVKNTKIQFRRTEKRIFKDKFNTLLGMHLGVGNYQTTLWKIYWQAKITQNLDYKFEIGEQNSRIGEVARKASSNRNFNTKLRFNLQTDSTFQHHFGIEHENQRRYFYGYQSIENLLLDSLRLRWEKVKLYYDNTFQITPQWQVSLGTYWQSLRGNHLKETQFQIKGSLQYKTEKIGIFKFEAQFFRLPFQQQNTNNPLNFNRLWLQNTLSYFLDYKKLNFEIHIGNVRHNDNFRQTNFGFGFFNFHYQHDAFWRLNLKAGNQIIQNNLDIIRLENPFLSSSVLLKNNNIRFIELKNEFFPLKNLRLQVNMAQNQYDDRLLWLNSPLDSAKFLAIYDKIEERIMSIYIDYKIKNETLFANFSWFNYQTHIQLKAWHLPTFKGDIGWKTFLRNKKWHFNTSIQILAGIHTFNQDNKIKILQPIVLAKLDIEYLMIKKFYAFLSLNNLFFQNYQRYLYYVQPNFNFLIGIKYELGR
jgi:hypothetical protein